MAWLYNDGGRALAGYTGRADDCCCRSVSIATGISYQEVYDAINELGKKERTRTIRNLKRTKSSARTGVYSKTLRRYMESIGWTWVPTMFIGQGCKVHLRADELPKGRLIVNVSKHYTAVIDGVIHDTFDPSRNGTRCVYGYFYKETG